jgi:3-oxoacyl-[acyl-carrier-protein] synthase II
VSRVVVTGIGLVTAVGATREATWSALYRGERGIRPITLFDTTGQRAALGGFIASVSLADAPPARGRVPERGSAWSRSSVLALHAAREAMDQAGAFPKSSRVGLVIGGTTGGMFETEECLAALHGDAEAADALGGMLSHPLTSTGDCLDELLGPFTRVRTLSSACSSGANAMIVAAAWLRSGEVDAVVAGGSDGLCRLTLSGFNALAAIDPEPCRPFDRRRHGLNLGEGAGFLVLERDNERGARVIAELAGWALGSEAHHITNPEPTGTAAGRVIAAAIARAGLEPRHIDYVNAHGTATPLNDPMEAAALARALGDEIKRIPVSSSKGQIGHTLGAAGAIEAAIAALAIERQAIVPTVGLEEPDDACPLVHVLGEGRPAALRAVVSSSFGFGGMDSALVLTAPDFAPARRHTPRRVVVTAAASLTPAGLRGTAAGIELVDPGAPLGATVALDLAAHLDRGRSRRLDRPARMATVVVARALADANASSVDATRIGVVLGSAFGSVDASAAFMHRLFEKGPRFASPADFPNLVPSSPVGHVSIYLGIHGPALATADLGTSGESACLQAIELVANGDADLVVGGALEAASRIAERRLVALFDRSDVLRRPRSEGTAAIAFESETFAAARGARSIARVEDVRSWRASTTAPLTGIAPPLGSAMVVLPRHDAALAVLLDESAWRDVPRFVADGAGGEHEGLGAMALAAAVSALSLGRARDALVLGLATGRGYALHLVSVLPPDAS